VRACLCKSLTLNIVQSIVEIAKEKQMVKLTAKVGMDKATASSPRIPDSAAFNDVTRVLKATYSRRLYSKTKIKTQT